MSTNKKFWVVVSSEKQYDTYEAALERAKRKTGDRYGAEVYFVAEVQAKVSSPTPEAVVENLQ